MKIENYQPKNELGLTDSDMRFWVITLVLVGALLAVGWISTLVRFA